MLSEFGADAIAGTHAEPPEMFSEEYQCEMLERYLDLAAERPWIVGLHVWNLADFKTCQARLCCVGGGGAMLRLLCPPVRNECARDRRMRARHL